MRYRVDSEYSYLRFQTIPVNVLILVGSIPIYLVVGIWLGIREAASDYISDVRTVWKAFVD
jgi:hypothetical protein